MKHWNSVLEVSEMVEKGVDLARNPASPVTSGGRKRNLSPGDGYDDYPKRLVTDEYSMMSLPVGHTSTSFCAPSFSSYDGVHTSPYPVSSLYYSPQRDKENGYNGSYGSQSRLSSVEPTSQRISSYGQLSDSNGGYDRPTEAFTTDRYDFPSSEASYLEQGYPELCHFHEYPHSQEGDAGNRNNEGNPPFESPLNNLNRFDLSTYQLDDDEELFATVTDQSADAEDVKPNRFKTQRERLIQARAEESEESVSTAPEFEETFPSHGDEDSSSRDSVMSHRERLRQFRNEHSHHVVIPNQWEGEKNLHEFVNFGNIEAALRPLGLMMARAALVNDPVATRHLRSSSSGPSGCHSNRSNPLQAL